MKYIICGIEHIGQRVVEFLVAHNESVNVITLDSREVLLREIRHRVAQYIEGDARQEETLKAAGIEKADVLMSLTSDDVKNLEIHLLAKKLNPEIVVITRMSSEGLSKEIEVGFGVRRSLSTSSIAAPSFVSACLDESVLHTFIYNEKLCFVGVATVDENSPFFQKKIRDIESQYSLKVFSLDSPCVPQLDFLAGEAVLNDGGRFLFITQDKNIFNILSCKDSKVSAQETPKIKDEFVSNFLKNMPKGLKYVFLAYCALITASVILFHFGIKLSIVDALYFAVTTTTTVGFGDFNFKDYSALYKLYGSFIMIAGAALLAALYSVITDFFISKRFDQLFGVNKYKLKDHIVIAGLGRIGYRVANLLHETGFRVVVIENDSENEFISLLRGKIPIIYGDAQYPDILSKAGTANARTVVAIINDDLKNINILLQSKKLNGQIRTVARLFNRGIEQKAKLAFNIKHTLSTSAIAAPLFLAAAINDRIVTAFEWNGSLLAIFELCVKERPFLRSFTPKQLYAEYSIYVLGGLQQDYKSASVNLNQPFSEDDKLLLVGEYGDIKKLLR